MYSAFLAAHSWLRWVVLLAAVLAIVRSARGISGGRAWDRGADASARFYTIALDIQFTVGLILYVWLSPFTRAAFDNMAATMRDPGARFLVVEHLTGMMIALVVAHVGRVKIRRAAGDAAKHQQALIFFGISLVVMLASIPWPGMAAGRPLFRF